MIPKQKIVHFLFVSLAVLYSLAISRECHADAYAYITNSGGTSVSVIKLLDRSDPVPGGVGVGSGPFGVAVDPDGVYVYVTNQGSGNVSVIDTTNHTSTTPYTVRNNPTGIAVSPDGDYLYVANYADSSISIIDILSATVSPPVNLPVVSSSPMPFGVAVTPAGDFVYVTDESQNQVHVIDTSDNTISASVDVGDTPKGIAITPSGNYAIVANSDDDTISVINTSDYSVPYTITVGDSPFGVAVTPDESYAYVTNFLGNSVHLVSLTSFTASEISVVMNGPQGVAVTPNGEEVYVVNKNSGSVTILDSSDNTEITTISGVGTSPVSLGNFIGGTTPLPPNNLLATLTNDNQITLDWNDDSDEELGFKIIRKRYIDGTYTQIATLGENETSYVDNGLGYNSNYYYMVCAYNLAGDSDYSDEAYATTEKEDESGCFIATAAYGSFMAPQVKVLRKFRDRFMATNAVGKFFLNVYYEYSPPIADYITEHDSLRVFIRWALLPFVGMSWLFLNLGPGLTLLCFLLCFSPLCTAAVFRFKRRKI